MNNLSFNRVVSFVVVTTDSDIMITPRIITNMGYKHVESFNYGDKTKHVYIWDSTFGVYLYWDDNFVSGLRYVSEHYNAHVASVMWDSNVGFIWFDSDVFLNHGGANLNRLLGGESFLQDLQHVKTIMSLLTIEEQVMICLYYPQMRGFFSNFDKIVKVASELNE